VSESERRFLRTMAEVEENGLVKMTVMAEKMGRPLTALSPMRASLIRKGMLYSPSHGAIAYTVPMFGMYMKRVMT